MPLCSHRNIILHILPLVKVKWDFKGEIIFLKSYGKIKPLYVIRNMLRYIINAKHCISSMQSIVYHQAAELIHADADEIQPQRG